MSFDARSDEHFIHHVMNTRRTLLGRLMILTVSLALSGLGGAAQAGSEKYAARPRAKRIKPSRRDDLNHPRPEVFKTWGRFTGLTLPPCQFRGFEIHDRRGQVAGFPGYDLISRLLDILSGQAEMFQEIFGFSRHTEGIS